MKEGKKRRKDTKLNKARFKEYLDLKNSEEALLQLSRQNSGLVNFLRDGAGDPSTIPVALKCFSYACSSNLVEEEKNTFLCCIVDSCFLEISLSYFLTQYNHLVTVEVVDHISDIVRLVVEKMPSESFRKVYLLLNVLDSKDSVCSEKARITLCAIRSILDNIQSTSEQHQPKYPVNDDDAPPEDFRLLSPIPRQCDLDVNKQPFLRTNKTGERYDNHDHYLDVQFRLLREDLIAPLRESICEYQSHGGNADTKISASLKAYLNVRLIRPTCRTNGLGYRIGFDINRMGSISWETSRRLIFGSLVCLSSDNFTSCVYATVINRDLKDIKNGLIDVCFQFSEVFELNEFVQGNRKTRFVMVESPSYYEPYKHVLLAMQKMGENNFPFYQYIVECSTQIDQPSYLQRNLELAFDLRPVADDNYTFKTEEMANYNFPDDLERLKAVDILDDASWPTAEELKLDQSQSVALRHALSREFAIVQGPPGTGKTHLGLNILKVLLHNPKLWQDPERQTPIVVICYTNHALDQFLCEALQFFQGKLIRVGSRSQHEQIKEHSITNHRTRSRNSKKVSQAVHAARYNMKLEIDDLKSEIDQTAVKLEIAQREIIHERCFQEEALIDDRHYRQLCPSDGDSGLLQWLGIRKDLDAIDAMTRDVVAEVLPDTNNSATDDEDDEDDAGQDEEDEEVVDQGYQLENLRYLDDEDPLELTQEIETIKACVTAFKVSELDDRRRTTGEKEKTKKAFIERKKLKRKLQHYISSDTCMTEDVADAVDNIFKLKYPDRWLLYRSWVQNFLDKIKEKLKDKEKKYEVIARRYQDILLVEDKEIMQDATIVGLTTTGAARYQSVLAEIGPKIIIFEEAAEVLEGHIIVNLCMKCEHAIFIGDHKQLRPHPTVHKLAKDYNLDISLFERLINNKIPHDTLELQHRMRPEISSFIRPIYPKLKDHEVVKHYPDVRGIRDNVYLVSHGHSEESDNETKSRINIFEGQYLKALCNYLMKQDYRPRNITILTTYSGQKHYISSIMDTSKPKYKNLQISTVDSYQGQENDIILLSLVRSCQEDGIGFLAENNRLCVAFSRAKKGFYVVGNFEHLQKYSPLLKQIVDQAKRLDIVSEGLTLVCACHGRILDVSSPDDFKMSKGMCKKPCNKRLQCGHQCERLCHTDDPEHEKIHCLKECVRQCDKGHPCRKKCFEICSECQFPVKKIIPACGHEMEMPCSQEPWKVKCTATTTKNLPCGHKGQGICSPLLNNCSEMIKVHIRKCGHDIQVPCHEKKEDMTCNYCCDKMLDCGHDCQGTCGKCYEGRLHLPCKESCQRLLICTHICQASCSFCPPCNQPCINKCKHNDCGNRCGEPCTPCNEQCKWRCKHYICTMRCSQICNRDRCDEPCKKVLTCGHACIGLCGETCPKLCRICDAKGIEEQHIWGDEDLKTSRYLLLEDCNHILEVIGLDKYMETNPSEENTIYMKLCPLCKTLIMRTPRYGNIIKNDMQHIQNIKKKIVGADERIKKLKRIITEKKRISSSIKSFIEEIFGSGEVESEHKLAAVVTQISLYQHITSLRQEVDKTKRQMLLDETLSEKVDCLLHQLENWITIPRSVFSEQEVKDAKREMKKLDDLVTLNIGRTRANAKLDEIPTQFMVRLATTIRTLENGQQVPDQDVADIIETLKEYIPQTTLGITDDERLEIVAAIGGRKGQWYQCQNGHYYSIGDCGRASVTAHCPECHAVIGGESHELYRGNVEAPEFDEAQGPLHNEESDFAYALQLQFG